MAFTYDDFRGTEALRTEFGAFLRSDVGMIAMRVLRARYRAYDVPNESDALVSARILSQFHGANVVLDDIEAMAIAPHPEGQIESTFESPDTDHYRMPTDQEFHPIIKAPPIPEELERTPQNVG
jgi:hypothetical protein